MQDNHKHKSKSQLIKELEEIRCHTEATVIQLKQLEESLVENHSRFFSLLDVVNEAIISTNESQHITSFNQGAEKIFDYAAAEVLGQPLDILLPERFQVRHRQYMAEFATSDVPSRLMGERSEIYGRRKNGAEFAAEASISRLEADEKRVYIVILRDIEARKQSEQAQTHHLKQLTVLSELARDIAAELSLEHVLQKIVESAQTLIQTKYAALGVHDGQGRLSQFITVGVEAAVRRKIGLLPTGQGLLGHLLEKGESLIVSDLKQHPASVGFPPHHPQMTQFLGVPIFSKDTLIGALYLTDKKDGSDFTAADQDLIETLALQAAISIENARLYEQTQRLAVLEERERIAQDLHDDIIQSVYAVGLALDQAKLDMSTAYQTSMEQIDLSLKSLSGVIQDIRGYIFDLRPQAESVQFKNLKGRLEGLAQELKANIRLPVQADISPDIDTYLNEQQATHLFYIAHEALSNAIRHAKANQISLTLRKEEDLIILQVQDDGLGFIPPSKISPGHHGLNNIQTRVLRLGATLEFDSETGQGTCMKVKVQMQSP